MLENPQFFRKFQRVLTRLWMTWRSAGGRAALTDVQDTWSNLWIVFWMRYAGLGRFGRIATRFAAWFAPPYKARTYLASLSPRGYIGPSATIYHSALRLGPHVFIDDHVVIFQAENGGPVELGERARLWGDCLLETGEGGSIMLGPRSRVHRGVHLVAYKAPIQIGRGSGIAVGSILHSYDHGIAPGIPYNEQPLETKGPIIVGDYVWLGAGVIVLSGVRIGHGAVVAAGSVVTHDIPDNAIAAGVPARVIKMRSDLADNGGAPTLKSLSRGAANS
jgi:acetyltransferase-like isoleucine patch superfamily enzyme